MYLPLVRATLQLVRGRAIYHKEGNTARRPQGDRNTTRRLQGDRNTARRFSLYYTQVSQMRWHYFIYKISEAT